MSTDRASKTFAKEASIAKPKVKPKAKPLTKPKIKPLLKLKRAPAAKAKAKPAAKPKAKVKVRPGSESVSTLRARNDSPAKKPRSDQKIVNKSDSRKRVNPSEVSTLPTGVSAIRRLLELKELQRLGRANDHKKISARKAAEQRSVAQNGKLGRFAGPRRKAA